MHRTPRPTPSSYLLGLTLMISAVAPPRVAQAAPFTAFDTTTYSTTSAVYQVTDTQSFPGSTSALPMATSAQDHNSPFWGVGSTNDESATTGVDAWQFQSTTHVNGVHGNATTSTIFTGSILAPAFNQLTATYTLAHQLSGGGTDFQGFDYGDTTTTVTIGIYDLNNPATIYGSGLFTYDETVCVPGWLVPICTGQNDGTDTQSVVATFPVGSPIGVKVQLDDASTSSWLTGNATTSNTLSLGFDVVTVALPPTSVPEPTSLLITTLPLLATLRRHRRGPGRRRSPRG